MSVTNPTLNFPPDGAGVLGDVLVAPAPLAGAVELLLLLLPHAATATASVPVVTTARLKRLMLPVTSPPRIWNENRTISLAAAR
jgi:hypothetical protein